MEKEFVSKWVKIALLNLAIVALVGVVLRYKIAFCLPVIDQRNLLHGHSHFAFSGWISQVLMTLLVYYLHTRNQTNLAKRYSWVLLSNLFVSIGMLVSFSIQGYAFFSIFFSTLSIFISYFFAILFWKDLNKLDSTPNTNKWFKAALFFNTISSLGPYSLAIMMARHIMNQKLYLASVFYYLHFQYNGWFLFSCIGLLISKTNKIISEEKKINYIFWMFAISCIPSFFLSALWIPIHSSIYILVLFSAIIQLVAWIWLLKILHTRITQLKNQLSKVTKWLLLIAAISMSIKLALQLGSAYPTLGQLTFGFRPIVIGYLHLVFLGLITMFILGYILLENLIVINKFALIGIIIFTLGVFINELFLMTQGIFALLNTGLPNINSWLLMSAIIMFIGLFILNIKQTFKK